MPQSAVALATMSSLPPSIGVRAGVLPLPYPSLARAAATSSRQKDGIPGTTRPQTEWQAIEKRWNAYPTVLPCGEERTLPWAGVVAGMAREAREGAEAGKA